MSYKNEATNQFCYWQNNFYLKHKRNPTAQEAFEHLYSELSASQASEAALTTNYHSLAAIVHEAADTLGIPQGHVLERAIAVKARIKASQEQEPVGMFFRGAVSGLPCPVEKSGNPSSTDLFPLYKHPLIPPELAELQRENAELTRKLAEQQAILVNVSNGLQEIQSAEYDEDADEAARSMQRLIATTDGAELRKLLERKVPDGREAVLLEVETAIADELGTDGYRAFQVIQKLKAQPKEPKQ